MSGPRIVLTNDDGIAAEGLHTLTRAIAETEVPAVVVAPAENRSGVGRHAFYGRPVALESLAEVGGIAHFSCSGMPVDCVRVAMLGRTAPQAELVVSGINHGPNLGDDTLNSGTVGAAIEGALLGVPGLAVSQQHFEGDFHILDSFDPTTPVYETTAAIAGMFALEMLAHPAPERAILNVNVPATLRDPRVEVTRLGRRFYEPDSVFSGERDGVHGYFTYGKRGGPPPPFEDAPGTDFGALKAGRVSATPISFASHLPDGDQTALEWAAEVCAAVDVRLDGAAIGG
ncbi:MAG TPA: 5'/3'-nucleotidase SurE [Solirubrobacterales bacterium]|nr:5'/3'-nucleotidase SurE [Solirubrobacterales bacterium]